MATARGCNSVGRVPASQLGTPSPQPANLIAFPLRAPKRPAERGVPQPLLTEQAIVSFLRSKSAQGVSHKTIEFYQFTLRLLPQYIPTLPCAIESLESLLADLQGSNETRLDYWRGLRSFFTWCSARYGLDNPMLSVARPRGSNRKPTTLGEEQIQRILAACLTRRDRALVLLVMDTGLRLGEVLSLTWDAIEPGHLRVRGKTGDRIVPIRPETHQALIGLGNGQHVFTTDSGSPLTLRGMQMVIRRLMARAGITGHRIGIHALRHTFATMYLRSGGNIRILQELLGHTALETTSIYLHLAGRDTAQDHAQHSPLVRILGQQ